MKNRTPTPPAERNALPFPPVPRANPRHDGWTAERQRAFIEALADTGSVRTAANMVNISPESAYALRRHPQAAPFRAAWEAALGLGVQRLKDEAFDRAINGQLEPVFAGGRLMGYRRRKNDRLLMFVLRHYGASAAEPRHLIRHISAKASASAADGSAAAAAEASVTTMPSPAELADAQSEALAAFSGIPLDAAAQQAILAALADNARRVSETLPEEDTDVPYVSTGDVGETLIGEMEGGVEDGCLPFVPGEPEWQLLGDEAALQRVDAAAASVSPARSRKRAQRGS